MSQEPFKFKPCIPPGTGASGPVNVFGQHRFVVLRVVAEGMSFTKPELQACLTLPNARIDEVLEGLLTDNLVTLTEGHYSITDAGVEKLRSI